MIRGKLTVTEITHHRYPGVTVKMTALYDPGIPEDKRFSEATPNGYLEWLITNPAAMTEFELGRSFYVDLTPIKEEKL